MISVTMTKEQQDNPAMRHAIVRVAAAVACVRSETCPECGTALVVSNNGREAVCSGCGYTEMERGV